jgi:hypothetical protein
MTPSGVSSPADNTEGPQLGGRCGGARGGGTVDNSGGRCGGDSGDGTVDNSGGRCGGDSGDGTVDNSGGKCGGSSSGDDKPESVPAASVGGSSSKRVVLDLPPPR